MGSYKDSWMFTAKPSFVNRLMNPRRVWTQYNSSKLLHKKRQQKRQRIYFFVIMAIMSYYVIQKWLTSAPLLQPLFFWQKSAEVNPFEEALWFSRQPEQFRVWNVNLGKNRAVRKSFAVIARLLCRRMAWMEDPGVQEVIRSASLRTTY